MTWSGLFLSRVLLGKAGEGGVDEGGLLSSHESGQRGGRVDRFPSPLYERLSRSKQLAQEYLFMAASMPAENGYSPYVWHMSTPWDSHKRDEEVRKMPHPDLRMQTVFK